LRKLKNSHSRNRSEFGVGVLAPDFQRGGRGVERNAAVDGGEALGQFDLFAVGAEAFAVAFAGDFGGAVEQVFEGAELFEQGHGALVADAGAPGMLSTVSPLRASRSAIRSGQTPLNSDFGRS
jgi:hypothetical protein